MSERIKIKMSEQAPVSIDPNEWPIVARVEAHDGKVLVQANTEWEIVVREHWVDRRRIVHGSKARGNGGQYQGWRGVDAGFLIESSDDTETIRAIRRVAGIIGREDLGVECIGELPEKEI